MAVALNTLHILKKNKKRNKKKHSSYFHLRLLSDFANTG